MSTPPEEKICFVIAPIGAEGTDTRKRSDQVFKHIIDPVVRAQGYKALRADHISTPGAITSQVIDRVLNAQLVVADLTDHNPNVFYELALRHATRKPVVQMTNLGDGLPFDVAGQRTIQFDIRDMDSGVAAKEERARHLESVEQDPSLVDSPVSMALDLSALKERSKPEDKALLQVISLLQEIKSEQRDIHSQLTITLGEPGSIARRLNEAGGHGFGFGFKPAPLTFKQNVQSMQDDDLGEGGVEEEGERPLFTPIKPKQRPP